MPAQQNVPFHLQENEAKPGDDVGEEEVVIGHIRTDPGIRMFSLS